MKSASNIVAFLKNGRTFRAVSFGIFGCFYESKYEMQSSAIYYGSSVSKSRAPSVKETISYSKV
jgi:hypothetical protein